MRRAARCKMYASALIRPRFFRVVIAIVHAQLGVVMTCNKEAALPIKRRRKKLM